MSNKDCKNCKHSKKRWLDEPCADCINGEHFEKQEKQSEGSNKDEE